MNFEEYQKSVISTAKYPRGTHDLIYPALGLGGETGEIQEKLALLSLKMGGKSGRVLERIKKLWRDKGVTSGVDVSPEDKTALIKELGDTLWYITAIARELGTTLENVAVTNVEKLRSRRERGTLHGSGDTR